jgi:hypothetical protein
MNEPTKPPPWASFEDVVAGIVRPSLDEVRAELTAQVSPIAERAKDLHEALGHHDEQLQHLLETTDALRRELRAVIEQSAAHQRSVERAASILKHGLRHQSRTLIAFGTATVALLVAALVTVALRL